MMLEPVNVTLHPIGQAYLAQLQMVPKPALMRGEPLMPMVSACVYTTPAAVTTEDWGVQQNTQIQTRLLMMGAEL